MRNFLDLYTYHQPSSFLSTFFDCFYQIKEQNLINLPKEHFAYPDGYPEIIINLGGSYWREDLITGKKELVPHGTCVVIGQKARSFKITQEDNCDIISLKLKAYGLYLLKGFSQSSMINKVVAAKDILGPEISDLIQALLNVQDDKLRMLIIQDFFESSKLARQADHGVVRIIDFISSRKGVLKIEDVCERFEVTSRTLENHFKNHVGLSPKEFSAVIQFNNFLINSMRGEKTFTEVALDCGYYDQAHLIRKFKSFTNATPRKHLRELNLLNGINMDILNRQLEQKESNYEQCWP